MDTAETTIDLTEYLEFISPDAIRIKGHRLGIEHILRYYLVGYDPDEIAAEFPGLELVKIYAVIAYYLAHRESIDAYLRQRRAKDEQAYQEWAANPSPLVQRLRRIRDEQWNYEV